MSITVERCIWCDLCPSWDQLTRKESFSDSLARKVAKNRGWGRRLTPDRRIIDLCPSCLSDWDKHGMRER